MVIAPDKKGSLSVGMSGKQFGELIQRVIAVSGKNRKPLMRFCIPALEIQFTRYESLNFSFTMNKSIKPGF